VFAYLLCLPAVLVITARADHAAVGCLWGKLANQWVLHRKHLLNIDIHPGSLDNTLF